MKVVIIYTVVLIQLTFCISFAQEKGNPSLSISEQGNWYKKAPSSGSIGIDLEGANALVKVLKVKKKPVVAVISSGADMEHEALAHALWVNSKEKLDQIDNDKNGFVDDLNGWNFISSRDGQFMESTLNEADREWLRLKDKYADIVFDGQGYFKIENGHRKYIDAPSDVQEYQYFKGILVSQKSILGNSYAGYTFAYIFKEYVTKWDKELLAKYPGKTREQISVKDVEHFLITPELKSDSLATITATVVLMYGNMMKSYVKDSEPSWNLIYTNFLSRQIELAKNSFENNIAKFSSDKRENIVGDSSNDIKNSQYGSNLIFTPNSTLGTLMSGIVAGREVDNSGFSGIIPDAQLMNLVVSAENGDVYPKDLALAIKYAVNNGADIIMLPVQNRFYSLEQKQWIDKALRAAEKKGVLLITSVWEAAENLDNVNYYPSTILSDGKELTNLLIVGNSDKSGVPASKSNFSADKLSMFVPSISIYGAMPGDVYKLTSSSVFSTGVAAGAATYLKAYFPKLNAVQIKKLLMDNVTKFPGIEVEKSVAKGVGGYVIDLFLFEQLCKSAGILNLKNSVEAALKKQY